MIWLYRRMRLFLDLRQADVSRATGVPVWKLSAAEAGRVGLSELEEGLVRDFLRDRLRLVVEAESQSSDVTKAEDLRRISS